MNTPGKLCRKCGYQRTGQEDVPEIFCPQCGRVYAKVEASLQPPEIKPASPEHTRFHLNREQLKREVPAKVKWGMRAVIYPFVILVAFVLMAVASLFNARTAATECENTIRRDRKDPLADMMYAKNRSACMAEKAGFLSRHLMLPNRGLLEAMPNAPCQYVGVWKSQRENSTYTLTLKADSRFFAVPVNDPDGQAEYIEGAWGEYDGKLAWFYRDVIEANPIENENADRFDLLEQNGSRTNFSYVAPTEGSCSR